MNEVVAYRFCAKKPIGRSSGKSVINSAAYVSRSKLFDDELGKNYSYKNKSNDVLFSEILTPEIAPKFSKSRELLWNNVQKHERHKKAQFARLLELNLPSHLELDEMKSLLIKFVMNNFVSLGMIADVNIHRPDIDGDKRNYHAHVLLTLRRVDESGFVGNKAREWNSKKLFGQWRENLALECSIALEKSGYFKESERWKHSHLTLKNQLNKALERCDNEYAEICDHEPTKHKGVHIHQMEKKGIVSYVEEDRKKIRTINTLVKEQLARIEIEFLELLKEKKYLDDDRLRQRFNHIFPILSNRNVPISDELREKINRIINSNEPKKKLSDERDKERDYERDE